MACSRSTPVSLNQCEFPQEGVRGFYRGFTANALKTIPSNGIRFVAYEWCKRLYGVQKARTDT